MITRQDLLPTKKKGPEVRKHNTCIISKILLTPKTCMRPGLKINFPIQFSFNYLVPWLHGMIQINFLKTRLPSHLKKTILSNIAANACIETAQEIVLCALLGITLSCSSLTGCDKVRFPFICIDGVRTR